MIKNKLIIIALIFLILITNFTSVFGYTHTAFEDIEPNSEEFYNIVQTYYSFLVEKGYDVSLFDRFLVAKNCFVFLTPDSYFSIYNNQVLHLKGCIVVWINPETLEPTGIFDLIKNSTSCSHGSYWEPCYYYHVYHSSFSYGGKISKTSDFFPMTPPEITPTQTLVEIMTQVGEQSKAEILPTILKVIAIAVGLVISLIALKKAFQILVTGLKT